MIAELTIDTGALRTNVARLCALAAPARIMPVIKANAYGHGALGTAHALASVVDGFCVYRGDEALALRAAGIVVPLLVLGPVERAELGALVASDVDIALWSDGAFARDLVRAARALDRRARVQLKIDTGVTRLGVDAADAAEALARTLAEPALDLRGVFTHLAAAEELESAYTLAQLERFDSALAPVAGELARRRVLRHAAASAPAILYPQSRLDAIRPGIATYGIWPSSLTRAAAGATLELVPALAWSTRIVVLRDVEAGRSVGYGCSFETARASTIAVLPIGYAEGLPRALSNRGVVLVRGTRAPIVGRVCMNMAFVDVTDVPGATTGDRVTLLGRDGDAWLDANEVAEAAGTIGFELVARLPSEIPRRYVGAAERVTAIASARSSVPS